MQKVLLFILPILLLMACETGSKEEGNKNTGQDSILNNDKPADNKQDKPLRTYNNDQFNFQLKFPENWRVVENKIGNRFPVINIFNQRFDEMLDLPVTVHAKAEVSFISIFPQGYGTELPSGQVSRLSESSMPFELSFQVNTEESKVFMLKNEDTWGYFLVAENAPENWQNGFLFAQISVDNFTAKCYAESSGEEIAMEKCNTVKGDKIIRHGNINQKSKTAIHAILQSFQFTDQQSEFSKVTELIEIEKPLPNQDISSPLAIEGKARGMWYFEGDFPVELTDKDGNIIAETIATAQGKWMTEDFVPFKASLNYQNAPDDERGYLVFHRHNASGLPEHDMKYRLPVIFPSH